MKVAAIQHDIAWQDGPATRLRMEPMIAQAAAANARLIVLAEMFATGFSMDTDAISEDQGGPNEQFLRDLAQQYDVWLIGSVAQWIDSSVAGQTRRAVNVAVVAGPQGELHRYSKIHPFTYDGEHEHFAAGTDFLTVKIDDLRVSVFICYDLRFADEFWQRALETDLYVVPANWPEPRREHWRALLRARAIENQAYVLGCNRVGTVGSKVYTGDSAIIDPLGRTLAEASWVETVLIADVDPDEVGSVRNQFPFLADRR
jgi:predicted amidohydrolase